MINKTPAGFPIHVLIRYDKIHLISAFPVHETNSSRNVFRIISILYFVHNKPIAERLNTHLRVDVCVRGR